MKSKMLLGQITPIRKCNLRCEHCFITNQHKLTKEVMTMPLFKRAVDVIIEYGKENSGIEEIELVLMGGEIHLIDAPVLKEMIEYAYSQNLAFPDKNIDFSVTLITNLVGISKEKLDIYGDLVGGHQKKYGPEKFLLATSYEPDTKRFNDKTLKDWESNISYLRGRGVTIACGITGTQGTIDMGVSGILEYLHKGLGLIPHYDHFALFGEGRNRKDLMPSYKEIEDFITEFFLKTRDMDAFSEFFDYSEPYALENLNSRWHSAIAVNFDGIVSMDSESSADDQFDSVAKKQKMFNIQEIRIIRQLMEANKRRILDMEKDVFRNSKCLSCEFSTFCKGGFRHYIDVFDGKGECAGFYNFIKNVFGDKL